MILSTCCRESSDRSKSDDLSLLQMRCILTNTELAVVVEKYIEAKANQQQHEMRLWRRGSAQR
jgi:hypothetical protein